MKFLNPFLIILYKFLYISFYISVENEGMIGLLLIHFCFYVTKSIWGKSTLPPYNDSFLKTKIR